MKTIQKSNKQGGFTLIELMVVVAIIGILASIAIPVYQDYAVKSKVTDASIQSKVWKTGMMLELVDFGQFPTLGAVPQGFSANPIDYATDYVSAIGTTGVDGEFQITMGTIGGNPSMNNAILTYTPAINATSGVVLWTCASSVAANQYLPVECQL